MRIMFWRAFLLRSASSSSIRSPPSCKWLPQISHMQLDWRGDSAYLQEQSVTLAPIISIGHLSTVSLAATTIATIVANVTAYSVINGLSRCVQFMFSGGPWNVTLNALVFLIHEGALDTVLAPNSTHARFAGFWCTYTAVILFTVLGVSCNF